MSWIARLVIALIFAIVAWLVCIFLGGLLATTGQPLMAFVGKFLETWAALIAVLVFLYFLFIGYSSVPQFWARGR